MAKVKLFHSQTDLMIRAPEGPCYWVLLLGPLVPLSRLDFKWTFYLLVAWAVGVYTAFVPTVVITMWMVLSYNQIYIREQLDDGWMIVKDR